jgi:methylase of polypeptide subunit release factors
MDETEKAAIASLRVKLSANGYNDEMKKRSDFSAAALPGLEYRYREATPLNLLIKLFLLHSEIDRDAISSAFDGEELKGLLDVGILTETREGTITAAYKIYPFEQLSLFCDFAGSGMNDAVYTPGGDSVHLARSGVRIPFKSSLDLCTGSGIQALMSASHTEQTKAVDLNPRAVHIARLNCLLNGIDNVDVLEGNLYAPVASETFDLITANPPFVTSQTTEILYRDGGLRGDDTLFAIMDGVPGRLKDGGFAQIVTHLYEFEDISHIDQVHDFAQANGFEAMLFLSEAFDKYQLASAQFHALLTRYKRYHSVVTDYLEHLDKIRYKTGYLGVITFRNTGRFRFKKMFSLNKPVVFKVDNHAKLNAFFELSDFESN